MSVCLNGNFVIYLGSSIVLVYLRLHLKHNIPVQSVNVYYKYITGILRVYYRYIATIHYNCSLLIYYIDINHY